jgi:glycosyltransferase involved in cell wall biosynthesis
MIWFYWISGIALALLWLVPVIDSALHFHLIADITNPQWDPPPGTKLPSLTIVVPARNEQAAIEAALRSLLALDYPQFEIIAVNDRSTDRTGEIMDRIAAEPSSQGKLRILHVRELPPRWLGKTHAMWLGAQEGSGEWILFTDADCIFRADALRRAIYYAASNSLDHLVLFPTIHMHTVGEQMMVSFPQVAAGFVLRLWKVRDPNSRHHIGAGAFNMVRREAYTAIGTFEALRLEVIDDLKLGEFVKKSGFRQDVVYGRDLVALRWFEGALGMVRNLEKNMFALMRFRLGISFAACFADVFLNVWPFVGVIFAPGWARLPFAFAVLMVALRYFQGVPLTGVPAFLFFLHPISGTLTAVAILRSAFAGVRDGAITWRGTKYPLAELRRK